MRTASLPGRLTGLIALIVMAGSLGAAGTAPAAAATGAHYVDCSATADGAGTAASPWNRLSSVNAHTFGAGDSILLKRGTRCTGQQLAPKGSGSAAAPVVVGTYGTGAKPVLAGEGQVADVVLLRNQQYWQINDLEISNTGATAAKRRAVHIVLEDFGTGRSYGLSGLDIHDVNGDPAKKDDDASAGIFFEVLGNTTPTKFHDVRITGNTIRSVDRYGIEFWTRWMTRPELANQNCGSTCGAWTPQTGVRITGNKLSDIGGDGIAVHHTSGALVEHNTLAGFQRRAPQCSAGMWGWNTLDNVFQYNEMSGGHGTCDAQGMDLDEGNIGTVYQYNYSHDNDGGFVLICNGAGSTTTRNVFRHNISVNDGGQIFDFVCGKITDTQVYGNYIYVGTPSEIVHNGNGSTGENVDFRDNVFYVADPGAGYAAGALSFTHNTFYGIRAAGEPADAQKVTAADAAGIRLPSGLSLDIPANSTTAGTAVQLYGWHGRPNQRFSVLDQGERGSLIVNAGSGLCLDVDGNSPAPGAHITQWTCHGGDNQRWTAATDGTSLTSDRSGLLLTADAATPGAAITQRAASATAQQTWRVG